MTTQPRPPRAEHTEGPWQSQHDFDQSGFCTIIGGIDGPDDGQWHYTLICEVNEEPDEYRANARLIAAAPELLAALRHVTAALVAATSLLERGGKKAAPSDKMFAQMLVDYAASIEQGRAAIARANAGHA